MRRRSGIFVYIVVLLACCVLLPGCSGPDKSKRGGPGGPGGPGGRGGSFLSTVFDTRPFNPDMDRLPPMYTGHNAELLYSSIEIRRRNAVRQEHETEEQHTARTAREIYLPLMGVMDFDSIYAFRITPSRVRYDEKDRVLHIRSSLSPAFEAGREDGTKKAFTVKHVPQLDNKYTVTRKNGERVDIEETKFSDYAVVVVNGGGLPIEKNAAATNNGEGESGGDRIEAAIKMTPEEAGRVEGGVMALLVGRLASPYTSYEEVSRKPSKERPGTYLGRYHYLYMDLKEIWFYDVTSGKILRKIPVS